MWLRPVIRDFHGCPFPIWIPGWPMQVPRGPLPGEGRVWGGGTWCLRRSFWFYARGFRSDSLIDRSWKNSVLGYRDTQATLTKLGFCGVKSHAFCSGFLADSYCLALGISFSPELSCACKRIEVMSHHYWNHSVQSQDLITFLFSLRLCKSAFDNIDTLNALLRSRAVVSLVRLTMCCILSHGQIWGSFSFSLVRNNMWKRITYVSLKK